MAKRKKRKEDLIPVRATTPKEQNVALKNLNQARVDVRQRADIRALDKITAEKTANDSLVKRYGAGNVATLQKTKAAKKIKDKKKIQDRRAFLMTASREPPKGLALPQLKAWQRGQNLIPTPERAAFRDPLRDADYYRSQLPPTARLEAEAPLDAIRQLRGTPTGADVARAKVVEAGEARIQETGIMGQGTRRDLSVAEVQARNARRAIVSQSRSAEEVARIQAGSAERVATITTSTPERRIQSIAADIGEYEAGRNRVMQAAGVPDLNALIEPMEAVAREGGSPGAFGVFGVKGDISKAESVIRAYNSLVSDPTYGSEMKAWFEAQPRWAQFVQKIQKWGMSLYEPAPPVALPDFPEVATGTGVNPGRVFVS